MPENPCPPDQYEHNGLCCTHCPEGKYVSTHCDNVTVTKCQTCPHETFMTERNGLPSCLPCSQCDTNGHLRELTTCKANTDRKCICEVGYYCTHNSQHICDHCKSLTTCPPGNGVSTKPSSSRDTECKPCLPGTFNNLTDYHTPCYNHTRCKKLGQYLVTPGTPSADAVCREYLRCCHWVTVGMGAGLVLTILICIGLLYWMVKHKKQQTVSATENPHSVNHPVPPPDIIHLQTGTNTDGFCTKQAECKLACDCITMMTTVMSEINDHSDAWKTYNEIERDASLLHSEPQEDEWPGL